jgi:hypothetical protein
MSLQCDQYMPNSVSHINLDEMKIELPEKINPQLDFLCGLDKAVNSFILQKEQFLMATKEDTNGINFKTIVHYVIPITRKIFENELHKFLCPYDNKKIYNDRQIYEKITFDIMRSIMDNNASDKNFMKVRMDYCIAIKYKHRRDLCPIINMEHIINNLNTICEMRIINLNKIMQYFYEIEKLSKENNDIIKSKNIASEIKKISEEIIIICKGENKFYKRISDLMANLIMSTFEKKLHEDKEMDHLINVNEFENNCNYMLSQEYEQLFVSDICKNNIEKINVLLRFVIDLFDKLEVILSM